MDGRVDRGGERGRYRVFDGSTADAQATAETVEAALAIDEVHGKAMGTGSDVTMSRAQGTLIKGDLRAMLRARGVSTAKILQHEAEPRLRTPLRRTRHPNDGRGGVSRAWSSPRADSRRARHYREFSARGS